MTPANKNHYGSVVNAATLHWSFSTQAFYVIVFPFFVWPYNIKAICNTDMNFIDDLLISANNLFLVMCFLLFQNFFFLPSISFIGRMKSGTLFPVGTQVFISCSSCLSVFNSHISALNTFNGSSNTFLLLSYIKRWDVENFPSEESSNMTFSLQQSSFFPGYIFHKYSLTLITAWPWQDLGSENIILHMVLWGYAVDHNTEYASPTI